MGVISETGVASFRANHTYHLTARAIGNLQPFKTADQKQELLTRFGNHLGVEPLCNEWRRPYKKLYGEITTLSFNVMDNHLHDVAHQRSADAITQLMSRVMARQADSFNKSSGWRGKVFSPFNATPFEELVDPTQIRDMIAYVELNNPITQFETPFASYQAMIGALECDWFDPAPVLGVFGGAANYCEFMNRRGPAIVRRKLSEWGISPRRCPYRPIEPSSILLHRKRVQQTTA